MPVNPDLVGRSFPATAPYLVGREKVREFARAVLATSPLHLDPEAARAAGYPDVVAPPTFPVLIQQHALDGMLGDPSVGIELKNVVHGQQQFGYTRPVVAGDELSATLTITSVKALGGNAMVTAETVIRDLAGDTVVTATSTLVIGAGS